MKNQKLILALGLVSALAATSASAVISIGLTSTPGAVSTAVTLPLVVNRTAADPVLGSATYSFAVPASANTPLPTYTAAATAPWPGATSTCGATATVVTCTFGSSGAVGAPVGATTIGTLTFNVGAAATFPISLPSVIIECTDLAGVKLAPGSCAPQTPPGQITGTIVGPVAPTASLPAAATMLTAGAGSAAVTVLTAGTAPGSLALTCTIPAGTASFAVTSSGTRTISAPAALGANGTPIGLSCTPQATMQTATLSCAQVTNPLPSPAALTATINCPAVGANTWAATPATLTVGTTTAGGTAGPANVVITAAAGNTAAGSIPAACTFAGANAASFNTTAVFPLVLTQTGAVNLPIRFQPAAAAVAGAQTATVTCTGAAGTTLTGFPITLNGTVTPPVSNVTPGTAPGNVTLPGYVLPAGSSSTTTLSFTATAGGAVACTATGTGYTVAPNPLNLTGTTPGTVTVTYAGTAPGTFTGVVTCNAVAPTTGGPFVYNVSTTVTAPVQVLTQIPTMTDMGKWLLIASLLGFGLVMVGRRQA
jgi:hypothetical protein